MQPNSENQLETKRRTLGAALVAAERFGQRREASRLRDELAAVREAEMLTKAEQGVVDREEKKPDQTAVTIQPRKISRRRSCGEKQAQRRAQFRPSIRRAPARVLFDGGFIDATAMFAVNQWHVDGTEARYHPSLPSNLSKLEVIDSSGPSEGEAERLISANARMKEAQERFRQGREAIRQRCNDERMLMEYLCGEWTPGGLSKAIKSGERDDYLPTHPETIRLRLADAINALVPVYLPLIGVARRDQHTTP